MRTFLFVMLAACGGGTKTAPPPVSNEAPPPVATVDQSPPLADADAPNRCDDAKPGEMGKCAVATMEHYTNRMCACTDKACADTVNEGLTAWGTNMAKSAGAREEKPDPELAKKSADIMTRYTECMTKLLMNAPPPPDPCGGGDDPCG